MVDCALRLDFSSNGSGSVVVADGGLLSSDQFERTLRFVSTVVGCSQAGRAFYFDGSERTLIDGGLQVACGELLPGQGRIAEQLVGGDLRITGGGLDGVEDEVGRSEFAFERTAVGVAGTSDASVVDAVSGAAEFCGKVEVDVVSNKSARVVGPNGGISKGRGPNYEKNQLRRIGKKEKKRGVKLGASCSPLEVISDKDVSGEKELSTPEKLKRSFDERRIAENELATQRARYNIRRNEYLQKSRVSEQKWETERLTSDEKLRKISEARLGASPGFAKTIVEEGLASPSVPSLSDGTVSPNSSISVEEVQKMNATIEKLAGKVAELEMVNKKLVSFASNGVGSCSGDEDEDEEDPRDKGKPYLVLRGECVPRKGEYRFKTEQFRNGNKVMAIDGKIVELNWKGKPARYIGGVEDITMPSEKDPYENLVNYDGYIPPMF